MSLLIVFVSLLNLWRPAFCKYQAFLRAKEHAIACICGFGRRTITSLIIYLGRDQQDHSADYKLYADSKWDPNELFDPLLKECLNLIPSEFICIAADDTRLHKSGKKIPTTSWHRDPLSPPFHVNFIWGLRFLQFSALIPLYLKNALPPRAVPVRFIDAPSIKRPRKKAPPEVQEEYLKLKSEHNLSKIFLRNTKDLRAALDQLGAYSKKLLMVCDGSFCNSTCMNIDTPRTALVARCRKNAKLCFPAQEGSHRIYDPLKFTPEEIRQCESIAWQRALIYYGGQWRKMRFKEVPGVLWQNSTKQKRLRLIVLAPVPYIRRGKRYYRDAAYLLCTDNEGSVQQIIQAYCDRWQIEVNHKEEKSIIGVGEAQVRNEKSVWKQPGLHVAAYSALLLASIIAYDDMYHEDFGDVPAWRERPKRNSCRALIGQLHKTVIEHPELIMRLGLSPPEITAILAKAA